MSQNLKITHAHQTQRCWILSSYLKSGKGEDVTFTGCSVFVDAIPDELMGCNRKDKDSHVFASVAIDWVSMGEPYEGRPQVVIHATSVSLDSEERKQQARSSKPARRPKPRNAQPAQEPANDDDIPF